MFVIRFAPAIFVFLWSTGWVTARFAIDYSGPLTFLTLRFFLSAFAVYVLCLLVKVELPKRGADVVHALVSGV